MIYVLENINNTSPVHSLVEFNLSNLDFRIEFVAATAYYAQFSLIQISQEVHIYCTWDLSNDAENIAHFIIEVLLWYQCFMKEFNVIKLYPVLYMVSFW